MRVDDGPLGFELVDQIRLAELWGDVGFWIAEDELEFDAEGQV